MAEIGQIIRKARVAEGLSQSEVALRAGTSQPALARYESGATLPTLPTLERVLAACGRELKLGVVARASASSSPTTIRGRLGPVSQHLRKHRGQLAEAAAQRGLRNVRVFGSLARGTDHTASDVDLLVDLKPGATLLDVAAFRREAGTILDLPVDVATADMLKPRIRSRVLKEALPL